MLKGKNVLLGVSGSIAAYKSAVICRELIKKGANVKVVMTPDSSDFITPLTLSTLSKNPVYSEYSDKKTGKWNNHVELAKWADFFLLAPATQNTIAKMANGKNFLCPCHGFGHVQASC
jgi:phosphopantothenoylcysteine decarboxylase/phosphopantothenate--cysteine ligase